MKDYTRPKLEVADIFRKYGITYKEFHNLPLQALKAMSAIENCRTASLGGHIDKCNHCDYQRNSYNSCRNRHCPKCQGLQRIKWLVKRESELLPIRYFHLVFTLPNELNRLALINQKVIYNILFKAATETVIMLASQKEHLGAKPGCITVLHTWGQNLMDHPHVHMIVTGGGLSQENKWINSKKKFFLPVKVMSKVFRGKFMMMLKKAYFRKELRFEGSVKYLEKPGEFKKLVDNLYEKSWVVYAKKPFGNVSKVLAYLGRYTHRIAISNHRLIGMENDKVTFTWKNYSNNNKIKEMTVDADEFIRRFLLHVLPDGFFKIRYYGLYSSRNKKKNLILCCRSLSYKIIKNIDLGSLTWQELLLKFTGVDIYKCPHCKKGILSNAGIINPRAAPV